MNISKAGWIAACVLSFVLGIGLTWILVDDPKGEIEPAAAPAIETPNLGFNDKFMDEFFGDRFFDRSRDPFKEMDRMQQQMEKEFERLSGRSREDLGGSWLGDRFKHWFSNRFGDRTAGSITEREDDKYIYYDLAVGDRAPGDVNVKVEDGMVTITGSDESKQSGNGSGGQYQQYSSSSFQQRFPLPANADPDSVHVEQGKGVITVRIEKRIA